jgi:hypothetical protein
MSKPLIDVICGSTPLYEAAAVTPEMEDSFHTVPPRSKKSECVILYLPRNSALIPKALDDVTVPARPNTRRQAALNTAKPARISTTPAAHALFLLSNANLGSERPSSVHGNYFLQNAEDEPLSRDYEIILTFTGIECASKAASVLMSGLLEIFPDFDIEISDKGMSVS